MIDVVFLLLVFFVWTASFQVAEQVLPSQLAEVQGSKADPAIPPPAEADFADIVVRVQWQRGAATWLLNSQPVANLPEVRERLSLIHNINPAATVIIDPDPETPLEHVIDLYDVSRLAGFDSVQFAVGEASRS